METIQFASLLGLVCVIAAMIAVLANPDRLRRHIAARRHRGFARVVVRIAQDPARRR